MEQGHAGFRRTTGSCTRRRILSRDIDRQAVHSARKDRPKNQKPKEEQIATRQFQLEIMDKGSLLSRVLVGMQRDRRYINGWFPRIRAGVAEVHARPIPQTALLQCTVTVWRLMFGMDRTDTSQIDKTIVGLEMHEQPIVNRSVISKV